MKKIIKHILYLILAPALFACTDLSENVYDQLPTSEYGETQEEIASLIGPAYSSLRNLGSYDGPWGWADMSADILMAPPRRGGDWWDGGAYVEQTMHTWNARSLCIMPLWNSCMSATTRVNGIISIVEDNTAMSDEQKIKALAELRGIRAFWYYQLVDYFGNVPLVTDFKDKTLPETKPRANVYKFIVDELKDITPHLRSDVSLASYGKFTKGVAFTLLAKMYLNAEEWTGTPNWQGALDACDSVMSYKYKIEPNWKTNFMVHNEVSNEIIFPICCSADSWDNVIHLFTLHYLDPGALGFTGDMWNGINAIPEFVKSFDDADKRKEGSFLTGPMIDPNTGKVYITAHSRPLIHTVDVTIIPGTERPGSWGDVNQEDGARINKWEFEKGMIAYMENDIPIFRLADVYLMKAEALVRLGKDIGEATRLVNEIRSRGFGNDSHNYTAVTLDNIYMERRFELAFEFCGRQDMIRFGKFLLPTVWKPNPTEAYRKLMPIPYEAWQTNNKLKQNPGYASF